MHGHSNNRARLTTVTLTIWKAIVHVHSTTNSILLTSTQQIQRVQDALDESLAECMGLKDGPVLQTALNADCGILPTRLNQAIELCSLHAKLLSVDQNRLAAQIHKTLISQPPTHTASFTENMRCAHITLHAIHLWGVPPNPRDNGHRVNRVLALPQSLHQTTSLKTLIKSRKNELMALTCSQQRQTLLQHAPPLGNPPSCPIQQYIAVTLPDLHRKKLNNPAPYMRTSSQIPTLLLLRARCQNLTHHAVIYMIKRIPPCPIEESPACAATPQPCSTRALFSSTHTTQLIISITWPRPVLPCETNGNNLGTNLKE